MSSMFFNKIVGAGLLVALLLVVIGTIGNALVHPRDSGKGAAVVTAAAKPEAAPEAGAAAAPPVQIAALIGTADTAAGTKVFKKCRACHTVEKGGKNKIGPNLWDVVNADVGKRGEFSYSRALAAKGGTWTYDNLNAFLVKPKAYVPGTKMAFAGLKKAKDRAAVIAYLRSLSDSPAPLPQ